LEIRARNTEYPAPFTFSLFIISGTTEAVRFPWQNNFARARYLLLLNLPIPTVCMTHPIYNNGVRQPMHVSRRPLEHIANNIRHFIDNGLRFEQYQFSQKKDDYLLLMGSSFSSSDTIA
jgi:hypothetical protein